MKEFKPWVEKYRPTDFQDIVMDPVNNNILQRISKMKSVPNMLFYGPPGTGKTTTAINFIQMYQRYNNQEFSQLKLHLNASDERGIDVIRTQIYQFAQYEPLFVNGMKFVVLDEVDYMTKTAQQALKHLISKSGGSICFCLICNYISKIDLSLQNEFLKLRFNQLPSTKVSEFLKNICLKETIFVAETTLENIRTMFDPDIRSMINYLQTNQCMFHTRINEGIVFNDTFLLDELVNLVKTNDSNILLHYMRKTCDKYNLDTNDYIVRIMNTIIRSHCLEMTEKILCDFERVLNGVNSSETVLLKCFIGILNQLHFDFHNTENADLTFA